MADHHKARQIKIDSFNPDGVGNTSANIFGLPFTPEESDVVIIPVPWDVTVSNHEGTSSGPDNILQQSPQIDLWDEVVSQPWKAGIAMEDIPDTIVAQNRQLRKMAKEYISYLEQDQQNQYAEGPGKLLAQINQSCENLTNQIKEKALEWLKQDKLLVLLGGDHSTPLGQMQAYGERFSNIGMLHIDAHADMRKAYMGFTHSHASVMYNASSINSFSKFVHVGLRDISAGEVDEMKKIPGKHDLFLARDIHRRLFEGENWSSVCMDIISRLPQNVYISFDIDGLDPSQCPSTGTPVPGGLSYDAVLYLFEQLVNSGKTIIGMDLVETGPQPIDGIIACRILYKSIALMLKSNRRL